MTKVMRFELFNPINDNKYLVDRVLKDLQYESWKVANTGIQMLWDIEGKKYEYNKKFDEKIKFKDLGIKQTTEQGYIPYEMKKKYTKLNTSCIDTEMQKVNSEWNTHKQAVNRGEESIISYKREKAHTYVRATQITIDPIDKEKQYKLGLRLLNSPYAQDLFENGIEMTINKKKIIVRKSDNKQWIYFLIKTKDNYQQELIDNLLDKTYKLGSSTLLFNKRKNKWMINLSFTFPIKEKQLNKNKIMGIDLGWNIPAVLGLNDNNWYKQYVGSRQEVEKFWKVQESRKKRMQQQAKFCADGRRGHGTKTRLKPVYQIGNKVAEFKKLKNHCWSKYIIEEALRQGVGCIQMEDLSGITNDNSKNIFLKRWTYFDLQSKIENKAKENGIEFIKVNPKYTSARCNKCGYINGIKIGESKEGDNGWRPDQEHFHCLNCNHTDNADANAAKNIAVNGIEQIIKDQVRLQEKVSKKEKVLA